MKMRSFFLNLIKIKLIKRFNEDLLPNNYQVSEVKIIDVCNHAIQIVFKIHIGRGDMHYIGYLFDNCDLVFKQISEDEYITRFMESEGI